jgi:putative endonuclease
MESLALAFLEAQGLNLLTRRFRIMGGEIDLICTHKQSLNETLVFVEVRYRASKDLQSAAASVNYKKQQHIIHTAKVFLAQHPKWRRYSCRFDVVTIEGALDKPKISWFRDAFRLRS